MDRRCGRLPLRVFACALATSAVLAACAGGNAERARREAEIAALRAELDEIRKGREADAKERAKQAGDIKAIDAQQSFLVSELKSWKDEREAIAKALEQQSTALAQLRVAVAEAERKIAAAPPAPAPLPPAPAAPSAASPDVSPDKLYATAMASFRTDELGQAVLEFTEVVARFPQHPLAPNAQYWIGEAYFRQRDYRQALAEFQKVIDGYPQSAQAPDALVKQGLCHRALKDTARARESWEEVLRSYPGTNAAGQARTLLSQLGGQGRGGR